MIKTGIKKLYFICMAFCLFSCIFCGCGQAKNSAGNQANPAGNQTNSAGNQTNPSGTGEATQAPDWTAAFKPVDGGQSASGGQASQQGNTAKMTPGLTKAPQPTKTLEEQVAKKIAELGCPTVVPPREFTPKEGQTELVLSLSFWGFTELDDHIVAELNHILQERGYSFYLTLKEEPEPEAFGEHYDVMDIWRDFFDAGEAVDLVSTWSGWQEFWKKYGKTDIERVITEGYLLPFSEYPDTPAKSRLRAAYPEEYWRLCSFGGENYGISNAMFHYYAPGKKNLLLNLDAAEQAGIEVPEKLDLPHLDELLGKAAAAGVSCIGTNMSMTEYYGVELLPCGLFVKCLPDGGFSFVNPFEDGEMLEVFDALNRYRENGWWESGIEKLPLVMYVSSSGNTCYMEGDRLVVRTGGKEQSVRGKVYEEENQFLRESSLIAILGISSASRHKEEALELLCLMHTDEEIVRLLRYGVEGIHYRLGEDGLEKVKTAVVVITNTDGVEKIGGWGTKTWNYPGLGTVGNPRMPLALDKTAGLWYREDAGFYGDIGSVELIPYPGDLLEGKEEELEKIRDVLYIGNEKEGYSIYNINGLWMKKKEDYKLELEEMRTALAEAGYNELIAELNQRMGGE